ncbi:hypothetical protein, partial [Bilophila wadsworthia]|uniref:hypothetical protein n=1 Tax=Bilophila wadsworthia TaxID=35833 RepID=UPI0026744BF7
SKPPPSLPKTFDFIESLLQGVRTEKGFPVLGKPFLYLRKRKMDLLHHHLLLCATGTIVVVLKRPSFKGGLSANRKN